MAFIRVTERNNKTVLNISAEHVFMVRTEGTGAVVHVSVPSSAGHVYYYVVEVEDYVIQQVDNALAYRRGR